MVGFRRRHRTPAGEIDIPRRLSISDTQPGPKRARLTTACSISMGVRFFNTGLRRLISWSRTIGAVRASFSRKSGSQWTLCRLKQDWNSHFLGRGEDQSVLAGVQK